VTIAFFKIVITYQNKAEFISLTCTMRIIRIKSHICIYITLHMIQERERTNLRKETKTQYASCEVRKKD